MTGWIAIDGGQSEVRVRRSGSAEILRGPGYVHGPDAVGQIVKAIAQAVDDATVPPGANVGLGHTGFPADSSGQAELGSALRKLFDTSEVRAAPDWVTAHLGALEGRPGIVLAVGTGAVCLGDAGTGTSATVGGWGPVFGDAGSAFWMGRAGIEAALRHEDGRASTPALHAETKRLFGSDLHVAVADLYASPDLVDRVAQFAPSVLRAGERSDAVAQDIVRRAVDAYVEMVRAAAEQLPAGDEITVSYAGGVLTQAPRVVTMLETELTQVLPAARVIAPAGDALAGAAFLAMTQDRPFDDLVVRTSGSGS